jgi:hypothetical protein
MVTFFCAMPTVRAYQPLRSPSLKHRIIRLYQAPGETSDADDARDELRTLGFETPRYQRNPVLHDWIMVLAQGGVATIGAELFRLLTRWLGQRKGRRIEIERSGRKVNVSTPRKLEEVFTASHDVSVTVILNDISAQWATRKKPKRKKPKKSR